MENSKNLWQLTGELQVMEAQSQTDAYHVQDDAEHENTDFNEPLRD